MSSLTALEIRTNTFIFRTLDIRLNVILLCYQLTILNIAKKRKSTTIESFERNLNQSICVSNNFVDSELSLMLKTEPKDNAGKRSIICIHTIMGNTFSLFQVFLLVFHVLVIAPRRRWTGFLDAALPVVAASSGGVDDFFLSATSAELIDDWSPFSFPFSFSMLRWLSANS